MINDVFVDSNVIIDVTSEDPVWSGWSNETLAEYGERCVFFINPIIYAEVSKAFERIEDLDQALPTNWFRREALPWDAAFLAGKVFSKYRAQGGLKRSPLPDFFIGAHAAVRGASLMTRNPTHFRKYFPRLRLIAPDTRQ